MERYYSYSRFLKEYFGEKIYKICIDGGFTCPNRDGTISSTGCTFCSEGGSGDFAESSSLSITDQIRLGKRQTAKKYIGNRYIAYFQAFTNTYAPLPPLKSLYEEALSHEEICALVIGTRPDCVDESVLTLLEELNRVKPVFLELGFQTCHEETARHYQRGYDSEVFADAVLRCRKHHLRVTAHVIAGLYPETEDMVFETIDYLNQLPISGIKISMLYILKGTPLGRQYKKSPFPLFSFEEYIHCIVGCIERLRPDIVIERLTGDAPKDLLIAPEWTKNKRLVLNTIQKELKNQNTYQGRKYV